MQAGTQASNGFDRQIGRIAHGKQGVTPVAIALAGQHGFAVAFFAAIQTAEYWRKR